MVSRMSQGGHTAEKYVLTCLCSQSVCVGTITLLSGPGLDPLPISHPNWP